MSFRGRGVGGRLRASNKRGSSAGSSKVKVKDHELIAMRQAVASLLEKSRKLKDDMTKALMEGENDRSYVSRGQHATSVAKSAALWNRREIRSGRSARSELKIDERDFVDFVLGDELTLEDFRAIDTLDNIHSSVLSSDHDADEPSDSDDPLRNESIIDGLFYVIDLIAVVVSVFGLIYYVRTQRDRCSLKEREEESKKKERRDCVVVTPKTVEGKPRSRVNFGGKLEEKSIKSKRPTATRRTSEVPLKVNTANCGGQKTTTQKGSMKIVVATKDSAIDTTEPLSIFCLLTVESGSGFASTAIGAIRSRSDGVVGRNLYLNCRMFWNSDMVTSDVCWNSNNPVFRFQQIAPILVTNLLLERVQNNIMVIEVWEKRVRPTADQLLGICKVPLHLFYLSFRDREVAQSLLHSQNAVVAADDTLPVVDLFCGQTVGRLRVFLALGTREQVQTLRRSSDLAVTSWDAQIRTIKDPLSRDLTTTHVFSVTVDSVTFDVPPGSTIWAESDCYVQYLFLSQIPVNDLCRGSVYLNVHRLNRVLCEPVMHWKSTTKHIISQSASIPIHRTLLAVCPRNGLPFQVWCKYYYPVEKEELVAEVFVPVAKLCSLMSNDRGILKLSLPLAANDPNMSLDVNEPLYDEYSKLGTLNVEIGYHKCEVEVGNVPVTKSRSLTRTELKQDPEPLISVPSPPSPQKVTNICEPEKDVPTFPASVTIERAVHLPLVNENDQDKMPNAYVSFSSSYRSHFTDIIPNSDGPHWRWQEKVAIPFDVIGPQSTGILVFKVCHAENGVDGIIVRRDEGDVLLGCASVDLCPLLLGFSQLCGWYNIVNSRSHCCGQIKLTVQPLCNPPTFHHLSRHSCAYGQSSSTDCYVTAASCSEFSSHVGEFAEQGLLSRNEGRSIPTCDDFRLDEKSRSFLMTNLKERLAEIDNLFGRSPADEQPLVTNLSSLDCSSADEIPRDVANERIELITPKTINVNSDLSIQQITVDDKESLSQSAAVPNDRIEVGGCMPKGRTGGSRIVAAIFGSQENKGFK